MTEHTQISRRDLLGTSLAGGFALALGRMASARSSEAAANRPNIVFIMTDDQGQWALGCYGNTEIKTPNIDRLAAEGVRFSHACATTPVCSPSRATFMTGLIPSQHGIHDWIKNENVGPRARCLVDRFTLLTEVLAQNGYRCGLSGKWHLGDSLHPHKSFDYWFAIPGGSSPYNDPEMIWQGKTEKVPGYITDHITNHATDFIEQSGEKPFFLSVQYNAPHSPWDSAVHPEPFGSLYRDCPFDSIPREPVHPWASANINQIGDTKTLEKYFASISAVDAGVGRIMETLAKKGIDKNTIVIYASDQGFQCGHNGLWGKGNASNPRNMYEESMLIPLIFRCPGMLPAGAVQDRLVSAYDFMPTILDLAGLSMPQGPRYAGHSYAPLLKGENAEWDDVIYGEYGRTRMIRTAEWKYVHRADGGPHELYNMILDPREDRNVAEDPFHKTIRIELRDKIDKWFDQHSEGDANPVGQEYHRPE